MAIGSLLVFVVLGLAASLLTKNSDIIEILSDSAPLIVITLCLYSAAMAYIVYLYDDEDWFTKNYVLNIIRFAFTPLVCAIGYFFV